MENKVPKKTNSSKLEKEGKNFKVNIKGNGNLKTEVLDFYNTKLKKMHIILLVIAVVLYIVTFCSTFSSIKSGNFSVAETAVAPGFLSSVKENALLDLVIIIAGITPYCFLSIMGIVQAIVGVNGLALSYVVGKKFIATLFMGGLIQLIGISLCVAIGLYFCRLSTKRNKYYHSSDFGIDDIKMQLYEIRKNDKKVEEIKNKKIEKAKKIEACNIKIPYLYFIILGVIAFLIQFIGVVITKI